MSEKVIVCACEDVTLHDLQVAIERGHRDLESVKRYTGLGTGICQGKQCVALSARLLVQLGGDPPELPITPRPPVYPLALATLVDLVESEEPA